MAYKQIFCLLILFPHCVFNAITVDVETKIISQLKHFLSDLWNCRNKSEIVILIDPNWKSGNLVDWFLRKTNTVYLAKDDGICSVCKDIVAHINFYIFAESKEKVMEYIYEVNATYIHSATFFIILESENDDLMDEADLLESIWRTYKFLDNFLITYRDSAHIVTYNPFFNETVVFDKRHQIKKCEIFRNKLKNLNGYKIKVSMFEDPPRTILHNGKFEGKGARFMALAFNKMNATPEIIIPDEIEGSYYTGANLAAVARKIDVSFMNHFTTHIIGRNESFAYPHRMDDFVVVVLKGSEIINYFNIHEIFDGYTWMCVLVSISTITLYRKMVEQKDANVCSSFMHVWSAFTGVTLDSTFKTNRKVKIVFVTWTMGCLVLNIIFSSLLASKIIKPKVRNNIDTIEELRRLNPKIYVSKKFIGSVSERYGSSKNLIPTSHLARRKALNNIDEKTAVVIANTVVELISDRSTLHVLKEHLLPGFSMYRFQSKSPFKKKIEHIAFQDAEHGLTKFNQNFTFRRTRQESNKMQSLLKFKHLKYMFVIFVIGHSFAVGVFILEVLMKLYRKRTSIYGPYIH